MGRVKVFLKDKFLDEINEQAKEEGTNRSAIIQAQLGHRCCLNEITLKPVQIRTHSSKTTTSRSLVPIEAKIRPIGCRQRDCSKRLTASRQRHKKQRDAAKSTQGV